MADSDAAASANLSRYDALLRISKTLSGHKTMAELFEVLADQLHAIVPFDYLALLLHDEPTSEMRIVVLEPPDIMPPFASAIATRAFAPLVFACCAIDCFYLSQSAVCPRASCR